MEKNRDNNKSCSCKSSCNSGIDRRDFLRIAGVGSLGLYAGLPIMGGPFEASDFQDLVPADKKLSPEWVKSLFERGTPQIYKGEELKYIGMPVGGICAGQMYLGGDGRLWHWDIFNKKVSTLDSHYAKPLEPTSPIEQGFAIKIKSKNNSEILKLDKSGFPDVTFRGEYPIGLVEYKTQLLSVSLEAFSPFIPLSVDQSSLPATIMRFTVKNDSTVTLETTLFGWLENSVCLYSKGVDGKRRNQITHEKGYSFLNCMVEKIHAPEASKRPDINFEDWNTVIDYGTMGLVILGENANYTIADAGDNGLKGKTGKKATGNMDEKLIGAIGKTMKIAGGESAVLTFALTWNFPNLYEPGKGRYYASKFINAESVAAYLSKNIEKLYTNTKLWRDTWYDSTLPYWFLDRTFANASTLATSTAFRFRDGKFWGWEGVGCCEGTCTHVWHYEQTMGRIFPELDIVLREKTDFNTEDSYKEDGVIEYRGKGTGVAIDGQAGIILRSLRDHQMSPDNEFLNRNWIKIKKAIEWLIAQDGTEDGILKKNQANTLDAEWHGEIPWLSGLYLAALSAGIEMALEMGDTGFAERCSRILQAGRKNLVDKMWNGEYFIQIADPENSNTIGSYDGCHIDQVFGQSWAWQVGLGQVLPKEQTKQALKSLWKYNFTPDVGPYRAVFKSGRWYAMAGEAGTIMCSWPKGEAKRVKKSYDSYFNECMNGFEHQLAGHMIWEEMVLEGLAIERAIHDRYHAIRRNPWNEVECGDHYARSMASYGVFLAACGFEYHGPKGHIGFAPRIKPENFKAPFVASEGWGTYEQKHLPSGLTSRILMKYGKLRLKTLSLAISNVMKPDTLKISLNGKEVESSFLEKDEKLIITLSNEVIIEKGGHLDILS
jgi:uncharacterized protein (DUF608 family)